MSSDQTQMLNQSTIEEVGPIEESCHRFAVAYQAHQGPQIEDYLKGWEEPERSKLLSELLRLELDLGSRAGLTLVPEAYRSRFPNHGEVVAEVFAQHSSKTETIAGDDDHNILVMQSHLGQLALHAQGGLGQVFRATDRQLSREVAVKFIHANLAHDELSRERFRLEAEITSRLEHPGVVPVYGSGNANDTQLFYAMRFVKGETLNDLIARFHDPRQIQSANQRERNLREMLGCFVAVCKTIAYAHNRGIVHRDIKPENVMLGRYGETLVIDWGLAVAVGRKGVFKESDEKTLMLSPGSSSSGRGWGGTLPYMSPEQVVNSVDPTPASDIYSLGVTLYKILVGQLPFSGTLDQVRARIACGEFCKPSQVQARVSRGLESICLQAMRLDPHQRYGTALELARDVENYLADSPVSAYREPWSVHFARWSRRHRTLSQAVLAALLLLTLVGVTTAIMFDRLRNDAVIAQESEHELRRDSVATSAKLAAQMLGYEIDMILRILEKEAADPQLAELLKQVNLDTENQDAIEPLQVWIDRCGKQHAHLRFRACSVLAIDARQVARYPYRDDRGSVYQSLGQKFAYRDYFHGQGKDFEDEFPRKPLTKPHISVAMESTNHFFMVGLSIPIRESAEGEPLGVLNVGIELGQFPSLSQLFDEKEKTVLLVDTRKYYMLRDQFPDVLGEGLLLHPHDDLSVTKAHLPHIDDATLALLQNGPGSADAASFLPDAYRDPIAHDDTAWIAAFAPVRLTSRPKDSGVYDTGWFIIVQQRK